MRSRALFAPRKNEQTVLERIQSLNWLIVLMIVLIAGVGLAMQYSVAGGSMEPWALRQGLRFLFALGIMLAIALVDIRMWMALAYPAWFAGLGLLIAVEFIGDVGKGGQRWLDFGFMRVQPSELMKIAVVMAVARYFHGRDWIQTRRLTSLIAPFVLIFLPVAFVVRQPDLGTGLLIIVGGAAVLFLAGVRTWIFVVAGIGTGLAIPIGWAFLKPYQQDRVRTFLNPESDPLGAGYQITQSKIALGSGGMQGRGFLEGSQSQLNFLPETKTDFIFTALVEEFGLVGGVATLALYGIVLVYAMLVGVGCRNQFGRLMASGLSFALFLYLIINVGMVMGIFPVVGVPLPLLSYGGSAMMTFMIAMGLILCVATNRYVLLAPKGSGLA